MELKDFIKETLVQIIEGGMEANVQLGKLSPNMAMVFPSHRETNDKKLLTDTVGITVQSINFDVALTSSEGDTKSGKLQVGWGGLGAGGAMEAESSSSKVSRVQFSIPIYFPHYIVKPKAK